LTTALALLATCLLGGGWAMTDEPCGPSAAGDASVRWGLAELTSGPAHDPNGPTQGSAGSTPSADTPPSPAELDDDVPVVVPEPASALLVMTGAAVVLRAYCRRG
jgi:hypothetical protein